MIHYVRIVAPYLRHLASLDAGLDGETRAAIALLCAGRANDAARILQAMAGHGPGNAHALAALGFIAYQNQDGACAIEFLKRALESAPGDAYHRALLAVTQLGMEQFEDSITSFRTALRIDPSLHIAHSLMWSAIAGTGRVDAAVAALKRELAGHSGVVPPAAAHPVEIEGTTLCIVDCSNHALAERALRASMSACRFEGIKWLTDRPIDVPGVETVLIPAIRSSLEYSRFMVKDLLAYIDTEHVLTIQWDGYVINPAAWSPEFLLFDYIGARWDNPIHRKQDHHNVGNGGFSLRSRVLLEALQDPAIDSWHPEDGAICREHRSYLEDRHGIAFAMDDIAERFSFEHLEPPGLPFGFHGVPNLARFSNAPGRATLDFFFDPS